MTYALVRQVSQTAVCNAAHNLEERLARWLLMCQDQVGAEELFRRCWGLPGDGKRRGNAHTDHTHWVIFLRREQTAQRPGTKRRARGPYQHGLKLTVQRFESS